MHEVEHFDFSDEVDRVRVTDLLTDDENAILMNMVDKCEDFEFSKNPDFDACDYAFELEKCWKKTDPEVNRLRNVDEKTGNTPTEFVYNINLHVHLQHYYVL